MAIYPPLLEKGDTIGVVAPASASSSDSLEKGLKYLESAGYRLKLSKNLTEEYNYLAGDDEIRISELNRMFRDPDVKAVFCARGGYGTMRILDRLDYDFIRDNPKIFMGYSDISAPQLAILKKSGVVTFSGPMISIEMGTELEPYTEENMWKILKSDKRPLNLLPPEGMSLSVLREGEVEGQAVGGSLSVITPLLGTQFMPDLEGAILIVEDIDEKPYRIDRYFCHMRLAGVFDKISGLLVGEFINCFPEKEEEDMSLLEILNGVLKDYEFPVIMDFPYGHGKSKLTIPIGGRIGMSTNPPYVVLVK